MSKEHKALQDQEAEDMNAKHNVFVRLFLKVAEVGNKLPDPLTLFVILAFVVIILSVLFDGAQAEVVQRTGAKQIKTVESLFSIKGLRWMCTSAVDNFVKFPPLGPVLAVMLGIGVAERTGFITMGLKVLVKSMPSSLLTSTLVFTGVMSSMVADAGYVVLTPLGAVLFAGIGRHPIAGLAAAFAGVSGGFSANLFITGLDPLLSNLTKAAAATVDPVYAAGINATANYFFMVASVFLITIIGTVITTRVVEPMLGTWKPADGDMGEVVTDDLPTTKETQAFWKAVGIGVVVLFGMLCLLLITNAHGEAALRHAIVTVTSMDQEVPKGAIKYIKNPELGALDQALAYTSVWIKAIDPVFKSIEVLIALLFLLPGIAYGVFTQKVNNDRDVAKMASDTMATMGSYIVLAFVAGQFVAYFNHTNLGSVSAVKGAGILQALGLTGIPLLLLFVLVSSLMNLFVGSASAKWAFMAPIFVPMLMLSGLSPELVQAGYRVGDSVTNIISPLMPYLPIIIVFAQKYDRTAGLGTIISVMLPYSMAFGLAWTIMLIFWMLFGLPPGPGAQIYYEAIPHM